MPSATIPSLVTSNHQEASRPLSRAHKVENDQEALTIAHELAAQFRPEASLRDVRRQLPVAEIEKYSASGLWALTVPKEYGGPGVSIAPFAEGTAIIFQAESPLPPGPPKN